MTAAHVAIDAQTIGVQGEGLVTSAEVVGLDPDADVALLYTATDLSAQTVQLSEVQPPLGAPVALLGFPLAVTDLRITQGVVSGVNAEAEYPDLGMSLSHLLATDAAINGGNSGGPALDRQGNVIGLVTGKRPWEVDGEGNISAAAEGTGYVVPSDQLRPRLAEWQDQVPADGGIGCEGDEAAPIEGDAGLTVEVLSDEEVAQDVARSLLVHGESINTGRYRTAWEIFTPRMEQLVGPFEEWKAALVTSYWTRLRLITVVDGGGTASVQTELTTKQDAAYGQEGQTCSQWSLTYQMVRSGAGWLMDGVDNAPGSPQAC
jgi:S1-C subfamily serine protease